MNLDTLKIHDLAEDPDRLEQAMADQQEKSRSNPAVKHLLDSIFLEPDRAASFARFGKSFEFRTILNLLDMFRADRARPVCEIGGGPGFLSWAMAQAGFADVHLLEPNSRFITGTGYLRTRDDAKAITIHNDLAAWHATSKKFDLIITKNCIHHFKNIAQAAATIRQKMTPGGQWIALREWFAETPRELYDQLAGHPFSQLYGLYEWPYPAWHYVEAIEIAGFKLKAVVPASYANNTLSVFQEDPGGPEQQDLTRQIDGILRVTPQMTVEQFWQEVLRNRFQNGNTRFFSRPQALVFQVAEIA